MVPELFPFDEKRYLLDEVGNGAYEGAGASGKVIFLTDTIRGIGGSGSFALEKVLFSVK